MTMEDRLKELERYGEITLSYRKTLLGLTWYAYIELFIPQEGVEFKVRGDYFENVRDALLDLENKLFATLQQVTALPRGEK
jgi:hypothetical protein